MKLELNVRVVPREEVGGAQRELLNAAFAALDHAYAPYSGFRVAAAVRLDSGEHFADSFFRSLDSAIDQTHPFESVLHQDFFEHQRHFPSDWELY